MPFTHAWSPSSLPHVSQPVPGASVILEYFPPAPHGDAEVTTRIRDETVTTDDRVIPADVQRFFAGRMGATVTEIAASHSGLVSQPEVVAKVIEDAAR